MNFWEISFLVFCVVTFAAAMIISYKMKITKQKDLKK